MSGFLVDATVSLADSVSAKHSGWRGVCEFEGVVSEDGERLFGCEASVIGADQIVPGRAAAVTLRFWAPRPAGITEGAAVRLHEGHHEVAAGRVTGVSDGGGDDAP